MAKCKLCGKHGLFVFVNKDGYCTQCAEFHKKREAEEAKRQEAEQRARDHQWSLVLAIPEHSIQLAETPCKRQRGFEETKFSNITPKGKYQDIVVIDTETTGLAPSKDRIVELAAIRYVDEKPVERFQTYINPEITIPDAARKVNGITDEMVAGAPTIGQVMPDFDAFVGESTLVAHNLAFDLKFIYYSGSQVMNQKRRYIDTLEQARRIIKRDDIYDYTLDSLCTHYYITNAKAHSALADADATGALFFAMVSEVQ